MDPTVIVAIVTYALSLLATVVTGLFQFRKDNAEVKKVEVEAEKAEITAVNNIADIVLRMNKQEIDTLRQIEEDLISRCKYLEDQLTSAQKALLEKNEIIDNIDNKLRKCMKEKQITSDKLEECFKSLMCLKDDDKPTEEGGNI